MRRPTFLSMMNSIKELFKTVWQYITKEDYPYNTEFGDGLTHEEMKRIDEENRQCYKEEIMGI